jgi:hypothetical protein
LSSLLLTNGTPHSLTGMPLSNYTKDKFVAPELSKFTNASIRNMASASVEQEHWLTNFILNTLLRVDVKETLRQTLFNFLRGAQLAFREYSLARDQTMTYLSDTDAVTTYFAGHRTLGDVSFPGVRGV